MVSVMDLRRVGICKILSLSVVVMFLSCVLWQSNSSKRSLSQVKIPEQYSRILPGCLAIINGDMEGKKRAVEELLSSKRAEVLSEEFYIKATQDCPVYVENRGFVTVPLSEEEKNFPIAYSMVIHDNVQMFERLLRALYTPQNVYCVHVDQKSSEEFQKAIQGIASCFPNVFVASKLENVIYASWSRVQADLNCMKDLLKVPAWRYLLNTCGMDFPIKTNAEMVLALKGLRGKNSMESEVPSDLKRERWQVHYNVSDTIYRTDQTKDPPPISTPMFTGSAYFVVSRAFVKHVIEDRQAQEFLEWGMDTYSPDEHIWATLHRMPNVPGSLPSNSKYDLSDMLSISRLVKWSYLTGNIAKGAPYSPCMGEYRRAVCVYGAGDLPWLLQQHHLMANKFDPNSDDVAIRCLESFLRYRAVSSASLTL